jgi:hypothetical protein
MRNSKKESLQALVTERFPQRNCQFRAGEAAPAMPARTELDQSRKLRAVIEKKITRRTRSTISIQRRKR